MVCLESFFDCRQGAESAKATPEAFSQTKKLCGVSSFGVVSWICVCEVNKPRIGWIRQTCEDLIGENPSHQPNPWSIHQKHRFTTPLTFAVSLIGECYDSIG